jgi:hypothetical protein
VLTRAAGLSLPFPISFLENWPPPNDSEKRESGALFLHKTVPFPTLFQAAALHECLRNRRKLNNFRPVILISMVGFHKRQWWRAYLTGQQ